MKRSDAVFRRCAPYQRWRNSSCSIKVLDRLQSAGAFFLLLKQQLSWCAEASGDVTSCCCCCCCALRFYLLFCTCLDPCALKKSDCMKRGSRSVFRALRRYSGRPCKSINPKFICLSNSSALSSPSMHQARFSRRSTR